MLGFAQQSDNNDVILCHYLLDKGGVVEGSLRHLKIFEPNTLPTYLPTYLKPSENQ